MLMKLEDYKERIENYCGQNGIDAQKLFKLPKGRGKFDGLDFMDFAHPNKNFDRSTATIGGDPMPLVLMITKQDDGSLLFEPTEYIEYYRLPANRITA